jgi:uncharacterized protein (DUF934 family)
MPERLIIRGGRVVADDWTVVEPIAPGAEIVLPPGKLIVPLAWWTAHRDLLTACYLARGLPLGVWLEGADDPALLATDLHRIALIAIRFPKFADGRGYSSAALLRTRYGFKGELRAIGDVLRDQLFYLKRVGFDAFAVRADKDIHDAAKALADFSVTYQGSVDQPLPLFRRRTEVAA